MLLEIRPPAMAHQNSAVAVAFAAVADAAISVAEAQILCSTYLFS